MSSVRPVASIDYESHYSNDVSIKIQGVWHYLRHPEQDIYMVSIHCHLGTWVGRPEDFDWETLRGFDFVSHNRSFDQAVHVRLMELYEGFFLPENWFCTSDMAAYLGFGRSLAEACHQLLGVKVSKATRNNMKGQKWETMTPEFQEEVRQYAVKDAQLCWRLWDEHSHKFPAIERRLSQLTSEMGWRGVLVNREQLEADKKLLARLMWKAEQEIPWAGQKTEKGKDVPLLSAKQLAIKCREIGIEPPVSLAKDNPALDEWLDKYGATYPFVRAMSEYRRLNTVAERIDVMLRRTRPDGRLGYGLLFCGAHTLRWSGEGGLNMMNIQRSPLYVDKSDSVIRDPALLDEIAKAVKKGKTPDCVASSIDLRGLIIAPPGKMFGIVDLAAIEPKVTDYLAGDWETLELVRQGMSCYEAFARLSCGWKGGDLKTEDAKLYSLRKAQVLSLNYGSGWHKFIGMCAAAGVSESIFDEPVTLAERERFENYLSGLKKQDQRHVYSAGTEDEKRRYCNSWKLVCDYRAKKPKTVALWDVFETGMQRSRGTDYEVQLPNGRWMRYRNVSATGGWSAEIPRGGRFTRERLWGSRILENVTQAVARDVFSEGKLRLLDAGYVPVLTVHDEVVVELEEGQTAEEMERLMSITPDWLPNCPLSAEACVSPCYKK